MPVTTKTGPAFTQRPIQRNVSGSLVCAICIKHLVELGHLPILNKLQFGVQLNYLPELFKLQFWNTITVLGIGAKQKRVYLDFSL